MGGGCRDRQSTRTRGCRAFARVLLPAASRGQQTGLGRITPPRYLWSPDARALLFISARELFWYDLAGKARQLVAAPPSTEQGERGRR